jgi:hypothetical protein
MRPLSFRSERGTLRPPPQPVEILQYLDRLANATRAAGAGPDFQPRHGRQMIAAASGVAEPKILTLKSIDCIE